MKDSFRSAILAISLLGSTHFPGFAQSSCESSAFNSAYRIAAQYLRQQKITVALPFLETSHRTCPSNYITTRDLILAYMATDDTKRAKTVIMAALLEQDRAELHSFLGELHSRARELQPAAEEYQKAARLDPSEGNIFDFGSQLLKFQGDSAVTIFRYGVVKYPNSAKLHLGLGGALYSQGLVDVAASEMLAASELSPSDPQAMETLGAMEFIPETLSQRAIGQLDHLRALYPRNGLILYYYAMTLSGRWSSRPAANSFDPTIMLKRATVLDPRLAPAYFQLGQIYLERNQRAEALNSFRKAVRLDPKQEKYRYRSALAYKLAGHAAESAREMEIYKRLHDGTK